MRYLILLFMLIFSGCHEGYNILLNTGKVPPMFFYFNSKNAMDEFILDTKKYSLLMPSVKEIDFLNGHKWNGYSDRNGNSIVLDGFAGHIMISTDYHPRKYTQDDKELEEGTLKFEAERTRENKYKIRTGNINTHIEHHGKANYPCIVSSSELYYKTYKYTRYRTGYSCYKFNKDRTKVRRVSIRLTYAKPTDPILAQEYTYEDLKQRAKRMLDSLVIKGEW